MIRKGLFGFLLLFYSLVFTQHDAENLFLQAAFFDNIDVL